MWLLCACLPQPCVVLSRSAWAVAAPLRRMAPPRGNAMLVGVGGSGKQSLARLAAHICGYEVYQIAVSSTYGVADFKEALLALYTKTGAKVGAGPRGARHRAGRGRSLPPQEGAS